MADEYLDVVNEKDEVIGKDLKHNKIPKGFISRVVAIFLIDKDKNFIICQRSDKKTNAAGLYDLAAFGNVQSWEDYESAAYRELKEETALDCEIKFLDKIYMENKNDNKIFKIFCGIFLGITNKDLVPSHEIIKVSKMSFKQIESAIKKDPSKFCPGFLNDFSAVKTQLKKVLKTPIISDKN